MAVAGNIVNYKQDRVADQFRILIDARKINDGGIGVYTSNLINGLLELGGGRIRLLVNPQTQLPAEWLNRVEITEDRAKPYSLDEMWNLGKRLDFSDVDLFHVPHYTLPYKIPVPAIITVHDLIHINHPEKAYYPWIAGPLLRSCMRRASVVLTVSQASRNEIVTFLGDTPEIRRKIRVVSNALDPYFLRKREARSAGTPAGKPRICGKYLLAIYSNLKPHKGARDLLEAFQQIRQQHNDVKLVLVGQGTEGIVTRDELLEQASNTKGVVILGSVSKEELSELYRRAQALVVASSAEGFCLPVLEAQAMGTPVIARPVPAVLELLTDNDIACQDFSLKSLTQALSTFLARPAAQKEHPAGTGLDQHLKKYDHLDLARTVRSIYLEVLKEESSGRS